MPTHEFKCDACGHSFEKFLKVIGKGLPKKCPQCGNKDQFYQILGCPVFSIKGNPTTLGQQAEINAKKMGKEQVEIITEEKKVRLAEKKPFTGKLPDGARPTNPDRSKKSEKPWFRDEEKPLDVSKIKDVQKYIMTGEK